MRQIKANKILISILALGLMLYMFRLDYQSPWLDEIHTLNEANPELSLSEVYLQIQAGEQMPPLYFYCLHFIFKIFGYTAFAARFFSAALGVMAIYSIYLLAREAYNKKAGEIAALFLCLNYFHLYYSQEARPYIFLELFVIVSFLRLTCFLKKPDTKNLIWYGVSAAMMVYGHFFGLIVLVSQYLIILIYQIFLLKSKNKPFFFKSAASGLITLILLLPCVPVFIKALKIKEFWIPKPSSDSYTKIIFDFFGNSEIIIFLVNIFFVLYILRLARSRGIQPGQPFFSDQFTGSFFILIPWIVISSLIPLVKSHISASVILNRYFIVILPAIIIILAIGSLQVRNLIARYTLIGTFALFSLINTVVIKKHYDNIYKTQFREATNFILQNNEGNIPVVSSLGWYMPYFLKESVIVNKPLEDYLNEAVKDTVNLRPFWYVDAHVRPFKLSDNGQEIVRRFYHVQNSFEGYDIWAKHFIPLKGMKRTINISKFGPDREAGRQGLNYNLETFDHNNNILKSGGWVFFDNANSYETTINIVAIKDSVAYILQTDRMLRKDVSDTFKTNYDIQNSGFYTNASTLDLSAGNYKIGLYLQNKKAGMEELAVTDKTITIR